MIPAHRVEAILTEDGRLVLDELPFRAGQAVEVIVLPASVASRTPVRHSMHGMVVRFDDPTAPVADQDWGVLQ